MSIIEHLSTTSTSVQLSGAAREPPPVVWQRCLKMPEAQVSRKELHPRFPFPQSPQDLELPQGLDGRPFRRKEACLSRSGSKQEQAMICTTTRPARAGPAHDREVAPEQCSRAPDRALAGVAV